MGHDDPRRCADAPRGGRAPPWERPGGKARMSKMPPSARNLLEAVAKATHRRDAYRALLDLLAQAMDVDLDRVVAHFLAPFAQALDELVLADQSARALQQHLEQRQL